MSSLMEEGPWLQNDVFETLHMEAPLWIYHMVDLHRWSSKVSLMDSLPMKNPSPCRFSYQCVCPYDTSLCSEWDICSHCLSWAIKVGPICGNPKCSQTPHVHTFHGTLRHGVELRLRAADVGDGLSFGCPRYFGAVEHNSPAAYWSPIMLLQTIHYRDNSRWSYDTSIRDSLILPNISEFSLRRRCVKVRDC